MAADKKTDRKQVIVRLKTSNYEKLKAVSQKNSRSVSNQIEFLVERYIESYERQNGQLNLFNVQQGDNNFFQTSLNGDYPCA